MGSRLPFFDDLAYLACDVARGGIATFFPPASLPVKKLVHLSAFEAEVTKI